MSARPRTESIGDGPERRGERGLTLIELMIAMVISTVVVGFLFGIHTRLSVAYRSQAGVSEVLQTLRSGRQFLQRDLRMAGFMIPNGVTSVATTVAASGTWPALAVINNESGDGPDSVRVVYSDPLIASSATALSLLTHTVSVADASIFPLNRPVLIVAGNTSCVVEVKSKAPPQLQFDPGSGGPYNIGPANPQCDAVATQVALGVEATVRLLNVNAYRIDPSRPQSAILQRSPSGAMVAGDWEDLGVGFTNLQLASRFFEDGDVTDADGDGDPQRDWYSGENQETPDPTATRPANARLTDIGLSIEVNSHESVNTVGALATPAFTDLARPTNNRLGDWGAACPSNPIMDPCGVDLANLADPARPIRYRGTHVYRWSTTLVDLRNMGVGL